MDLIDKDSIRVLIKQNKIKKYMRTPLSVHIKDYNDIINDKEGGENIESKP